MYLQGDLQAVFDALYYMGVIDPVLEMDWTQTLEKMEDHYEEYIKIVEVVNQTAIDIDELMSVLETFDEMSLSFLAMEVAREFSDYHSREAIH